ncbi:TIGR04211 family SH3 domain-containing protein [Aliiglaciecola sp. CAU 1673]|uniref:TIGR04211 family SH3 domain-containing protein n=1 Tax=Aliiglaciecola sp. CAU 1673 TaxID=3032595 RepID=UPI0023DA8CC3|nr:TIGR04211 family SH3 domain-containing protein [Aliiglaciecola sp. CAU 1673]MDF2178986.1 TIGR04211 family SH3 domain-containing protein [Aliiglaciecola sp. CAU 1673]
MLKNLFIVLLLSLSAVLAAGSVSAQEPATEGKTMYITDDLYTFLHAGPGRNYRILGSVVAGSKVTQLQRDEQEGFVEIIDDKQRSGWVDGRFVSDEPSVRESVPELRQALQKANQDLNAERAQTEPLKQQIANLQSSNQQLLSRIQQMQQEQIELERQLDHKEGKVQIEWLTRGGIIGLAGIILGVIIMLIPRKRKRNDAWM